MRRRGRPPKLSKESILQAASEMDLRRLSIVKLAQSLEVTDAAIYYYFDSRAALVRAVIDQGSVGFAPPRIEKDWWCGMTDYALRVYDSIIESPGAAQAMIGGGISGPVQMRIFGAVIRSLVDVGHDQRSAVMIYSAYFRAALYAAFAQDELDTVGGLELTVRERLAVDAGDTVGVDLSPFIADAELYEPRRQLKFLLDVISDGFSSR